MEYIPSSLLATGLGFRLEYEISCSCVEQVARILVTVLPHLCMHPSDEVELLQGLGLTKQDSHQTSNLKSILVTWYWDDLRKS